MAVVQRHWATAAVLFLVLIPVSPALAQPDPLAEVVSALEAHDPRAALRRFEALPEPVQARPRARYLRGRLHERLGEHDKAAEAWDDLDAGLPEAVLRDARWRRAVALVRAGDCATAGPMLEELATDRTARGAVIRALRGQCALRSGDLDRAIEQLRDAAREDARRVDTFGVRLHLAEALGRRGDAGAAADELRALLIARPEHPDADVAEAQLRALGRPPEWTAEDRMARAERFLDRNRPADALAALDGGEPPSGRDERARWLHLRGMALYGTRHDYAEAARVLAQAARLGGRFAEEDAFHSARALSRSDQDDAAIRAYRRFVRRHPRHAKAPLAEYLAAWLELHHGRRAGIRNMKRFLDGSRGRARSSLARDASWHVALASFERRRWRDAAEGFERYAAMGAASDPMVRGRGLYWLGRARMESGDRAGAVRAWRETLHVQPLHWYALLARQRLAEAGEEPGDPFPASDPRPTPAPFAPPDLPPEVTFYASVGLRADAIEALEAREDALREAAPDGRGLEAVVAAHRALGSVSRPYRLVVIRERDELGRRPDAANGWIWEAAYPRPWSDEIEQAARANGVEPELLWAIMRQESGYDPEAVSYADAIGLLQLLPRTAAQVARGQGLELRREMLFDPAWNVRLASTYVGGLVRTFEGRPPLAIGAFNAGGHRIREWLEEARRGVQLDLFVERIPFDQTRNYVRRVTTHLARYLYLRDPAAGWPFELRLELRD